VPWVNCSADNDLTYLLNNLLCANDLTAPSAAAIAVVLRVATETDAQVLSPLDTAALNYAPTNLSQFSP
jgi:hypothetical protein